MAASIAANSIFWVSPTNTNSAVDLDAYIGRFNNGIGDSGLRTFKLDMLDYLLSILWGIPGARAHQDRDNHAGSGGRAGGMLPAFTDVERAAILLNRNMLYRHDTLYMQYTTYNNYPVLGLVDKYHPDFMVHGFDSRGDGTGFYGDYRYAHLIDIFHVLVRSPRSHRMHRVTMLFVRWYAPEHHNLCTDPVHTDFPTGCPRRQRFLQADHPEAFGFLDPTQVIRPVNIIPDFTSGRSLEYLGRSAIRTIPNNTDFNFYFINCMHDHDLFFRLHLPSAMFHFMRGMLGPRGPILQEYVDRCTPKGQGITDTTSIEALVEENTLEELDYEYWQNEEIVKYKYCQFTGKT